jgi:hypothetical protein
MTYSHLDDAKLHRLVRRRLRERPEDPLEWQASIDEPARARGRDQRAGGAA